MGEQVIVKLGDVYITTLMYEQDETLWLSPSPNKARVFTEGDPALQWVADCFAQYTGRDHEIVPLPPDIQNRRCGAVGLFEEKESGE